MQPSSSPPKDCDDGRTVKEGNCAPLVPEPPPPPYEANAFPSRPTATVRLVHSFRPRRWLIVVAIGCLVWCVLVSLYQAAAGPNDIGVEEKVLYTSLRQCESLLSSPTLTHPDPASRTVNPRWNPARGQNRTVILRNATLFDGESFRPSRVDIRFYKGLVIAVSDASPITSRSEAADEIALDGKFVTPGLVDMHSHHLVEPWPDLPSSGDGNEMSPLYGPLTPMVRALDSMKAYDIATEIIASGGVTSSLVIPGSANIMGGEGAPVKNALRRGELGEYVVEEMLLEHGIDIWDRHRYMKMACGENPKRVYGHTRMGNIWILREQLAKAAELVRQQDGWCEKARLALNHHRVNDFFREHGTIMPMDLKLESTAAMLRGRVAMHNHCYLPEDFEAMLRVSREFGFRVRAFHHAIEAWQVPEMLKAYGENLTIATFAEFAFYKHEAYSPSLFAPKILDDHHIPVALKSDHFEDVTSAKYLLYQAAVAHSFNLAEDKALQAVTSIPAKAIDLDYRVGYVRTGYDADIVVWDSHPLSIGATPLQVYIDGVPALDPNKVEESFFKVQHDPVAVASRLEPEMRSMPDNEFREDFCTKAATGKRFVVTGIKTSFLEAHDSIVTSNSNGSFVMVIDDGALSCFGTNEMCHDQTYSEDEGAISIHLRDGHVVPGLTAVTEYLGMKEILAEEDTGSGAVSPKLDVSDPLNVDYAKYGVSLHGKAFARARMGGVTRAVSPPLTRGGLIRGVSVGFVTSGKKNLINGGIFKDDVALHVAIGPADKVGEGSVGMAIQKLRRIISDNESKGSKSIYGKVADGDLPLVITARSKEDIQQAILIKKDFPVLKLVILGGQGTPGVINELSETGIPVILTGNRGAPWNWENKDALPGPPLSRMPATYLSEGLVEYGISIPGVEGRNGESQLVPLNPTTRKANKCIPIGDYRLNSLGLEASWAAKFAGLDKKKAIELVSTKIEDILGLPRSRDIVLWEGSPLQFGGTVALSFQEEDDGSLKVASCWPGEQDE
ncbi:hypothetical protein MKZ38_007586 [Zalerion maritima]|uniref:Amidohydrolase-related domain-containing protein n=1 Tax=Zalerion maritima TaxID=339359 RepID=A0AAD5RUV4_9PEZI|nr:hypothetical protein MKZ38_007586 [Zalerion maritima]